MKGILVNIFGGIMKCDIIADGIVAAAQAKSTLEGSAGGPPRRHQCRAGQGDPRRISGLPIVAANDLGDAARKIVAEVKKAALTSQVEVAFTVNWAFIPQCNIQRSLDA